MTTISSPTTGRVTADWASFDVAPVAGRGSARRLWRNPVRVRGGAATVTGELSRHAGHGVRVPEPADSDDPGVRTLPPTRATPP
jgi:hypothetical protein